MKIYNALVAHATKLLGEPTETTPHDWLGIYSTWQTANGKMTIINWTSAFNGWEVIVEEDHRPIKRFGWSRKGERRYRHAMYVKQMIADFAELEDRMSEEAKILRAMGLTGLVLAAGFDLDDIAIYGSIGLFGEQIVRIERCREGGGDPPVGSPDDNIFFYAGDGKTPSKVSLKIEHGDCITLMSGPADQLAAALTQGIPTEVQQ